MNPPHASFLTGLLLSIVVAGIVRPVELADAGESSKAAVVEPIPLRPGPHLFVDGRLVERSTGVERRVVSPRRFLKDPIVTGAVEHQNWQPFLTVLHDPARSGDGGGTPFRMWYNVDVVDDPRDGEWAGATGLLESADGVHWPGPYKRLTSLTADGRVRFGASVLDDGPQAAAPAERYKMLYFDAGKLIGPRVAFSPDGIEWTVHDGGRPILPKTPSDDIWTAGFDPLRGRYFLIGKHFGPHQWTNAEGEPLNVPIRRYFASYSRDFKAWSDPMGHVFSPDAKDSGITQWYGAAGFLVRGDLILGFLRELRDDRTPAGAPPEAVAANNGGSANLGANLLGKKGGSGMGYTVLCWTRDGQTWHRDRFTDRYFDPDPAVGAWDHAMAWIGSAVPVGDEVFLYYAGYRWGHKYHHSVDRQFGLVKVQRDRFVARTAGQQPGTLTTPAVTIEAAGLTLNVDAPRGEVRVQITDVDGQPLPGFAYADCRAIAADSLAAPVEWKGSLASLHGKPVRFEFSLRNASLFGFQLAPRQ